MRIVASILAAVIGLNIPAWAAGLKMVSPAECKPGVADYALMWWANGWNQHAPLKPAILCIQTGRYGLELDVEKVQLLRFGAIARASPYEVAVKEEPNFLDALPAGKMELAVQTGERRYTCRQAAVEQKDWLNFPVRMIENGRFVQRCDLLQLRFADDEGHFLEAEGRLEIIAWPDRLSLLLELTPKADLEDAWLSMAIGSAGQRKLKRSERSEPGRLAAGKTYPLSLSVDFEAGPLPGPTVTVTVADRAQTDALLPVEYDPVRAWHRVTLPKWHWSVVQEPDHLDRFKVSLKNPSAAARVVHLMFDAEEAIPGITGFTPLLRDANGFPTGIPVQLSKNWHRQEKRRLLYEGPWFHGFTLLHIPAQSELECEFDITWARWGGVPTASHSQLCLVGWGWNQLWDQAAIGSWGESICYEPDAIQQQCRIDDVRPLMVWGMGGEKTKWSWTHNVGGGDFLVYYNQRGEYVPLISMKTAYQAHGPNLTRVTYSGISADRHIRAVLDVSTPRSDDINRAYHRFRYDILQPTPFSRLAFYQLGSDNYHWHQYNLMARGNETGLVEEWKPNRGGKKYDRSAVPCAGAVPWFSLHDAIPQDNLKPVKGAWANRGLVIRSWKARLSGKEAPLCASVFGTEAGRVPSANLELSAPPGISQLEPGDFVEAQVELLILPMCADDYYGPNQNLRSSLEATANTWKPVYRQAVGNDLKLHVSRGTPLGSWPPVLKVDALGSAELEITGGVGYVPLSFCNLKSYRNPRLVANAEGTARPIDQSIHGNDFWQTDYDPAEGKWRVTYNIPLDSPNDAPRTVKLRFESGDVKGSTR